jgi:hypothetical protein
MKLHAVEPQFIELMPPTLQEGVLYISMTYATTTHLSACGCSNKVVLPLSPADWQLYFDGERISLTPSIGNWQFPCQSHYWIRGSRVCWAGRWSKRQIEVGRSRDNADTEAYFSARLPVSEVSQVAVRDQTRPQGLLSKFTRFFKH